MMESREIIFKKNVFNKTCIKTLLLHTEPYDYKHAGYNKPPHSQSCGKYKCLKTKTLEEYDGETTFSPTNSSKDHLNAEQLPQNNF